MPKPSLRRSPGYRQPSHTWSRNGDLSFVKRVSRRMRDIVRPGRTSSRGSISCTTGAISSHSARSGAFTYTS